MDCASKSSTPDLLPKSIDCVGRGMQGGVLQEPFDVLLVECNLEHFRPTGYFPEVCNPGCGALLLAAVF